MHSLYRDLPLCVMIPSMWHQQLSLIQQIFPCLAPSESPRPGWRQIRNQIDWLQPDKVSVMITRLYVYVRMTHVCIGYVEGSAMREGGRKCFHALLECPAETGAGSASEGDAEEEGRSFFISRLSIVSRRHLSVCLSVCLSVAESENHLRASLRLTKKARIRFLLIVSG